MLTLYHNGLSSCSQKVRFVLEQKKIPWSSIELNLREGDQFNQEYTKLNPKAVVPTLVHDDSVIIESAIICQYLDESIGEPLLTPKDALGRANMRQWIQPIDEYLHADISVISHAIVFADEIRAANDTDEKLDLYLAKIPDPEKRAMRRELITKSTKATPFRGSLLRYKKFVAKINATLADRPYLLGDDLTIADAVCLPYIVRFQHLNQTNLLDELPEIKGWRERMFDTDGYRLGLEKWFHQKGIDNMMRNGEEKRESVKSAWQEV